VWMEAIGLDVIDDLIQSGALDSSMRDAIQRYPLSLSGATGIAPTPDGTPVTFDWNVDDPVAQNNMQGNGQLCTDSNPMVNVTLPPTQ